MKFDIGISLPAKAVTQKLAWIGTSGGGKTYGAMKLAEEFYKNGAQFVTLDPVGVWYGLRLDKSGKKPSDIKIPVFGGLHGDIPLESTSGKLVADLVVDKGLTVILDVSQFESDAEKARFAADFADRYFFRRKAAPAAGHIFLEECQEFIPQNPQRGEERMLHVFVRLQKIGRNFGIGTSLITQRPQEVSKKALNLAGTLFAFRTTGSHERKAIELWMQDNSVDDKDIVGTLPSLETGAPHVWSAEWLKISKVIKIKEKHTFDASATPEVGAKSVVRTLGDIDLEKIQKEMAATIEKAKNEDPKMLRAHIAKLEKTLAMKHGTFITKEVSKTDQKVVERALAARDKEWQAKLRLSNNQTERATRILRKIDAALKEHGGVIHEIFGPDSLQTGVLNNESAQNAIRHAKEMQEKYAPNAPEGILDLADTVPMNVGERKVLAAIAMKESSGITREHITVFTDYKSSTRNAYIQRLQQRSYVLLRNGRIFATPKGIEALGPDFEPLPEGQALVEHLMRTLPEGERSIFKVLIDAGGTPISREMISGITNYKQSTRNAYIQRLMTRELVQIHPDGGVCASQILFV